MLKSMTGFGRAEQTVNDKTYLVEIKSLNGKQLEINLKIPPLLKSFEFDVRSLLQENLLRGTVECFIIIKQNGSSKPVVINTDLIKGNPNNSVANGEGLALSASGKSMLLPGYNNLLATNFMVSGFGVISV